MTVRNLGKLGKLKGTATVIRKDGTVEEIPFVVKNVRPEDADRYKKEIEEGKPVSVPNIDADA